MTTIKRNTHGFRRTINEPGPQRAVTPVTEHTGTPRDRFIAALTERVEAGTLRATDMQAMVAWYDAGCPK